MPAVRQLDIKSLSLVPAQEAAKVKSAAGFSAPEVFAAAAEVEMGVAENGIELHPILAIKFT